MRTCQRHVGPNEASPSPAKGEPLGSRIPRWRTVAPEHFEEPRRRLHSVAMGHRGCRVQARKQVRMRGNVSLIQPGAAPQCPRLRLRATITFPPWFSR